MKHKGFSFFLFFFALQSADRVKILMLYMCYIKYLEVFVRPCVPTMQVVFSGAADHGRASTS